MLFWFFFWLQTNKIPKTGNYIWDLLEILEFHIILYYMIWVLNIAVTWFWLHEIEIFVAIWGDSALWEISLKTSSTHFGSKNLPKLGTKTASRSFGCCCTMGDFFKNQLKSLWVQKSTKIGDKNSVVLIWLLLHYGRFL